MKPYAYFIGTISLALILLGGYKAVRYEMFKTRCAAEGVLVITSSYRVLCVRILGEY